VKSGMRWELGDTGFLANVRPRVLICNTSGTYEMLEVLEFCQGSV
jgi:hypothetical protein